MPDTTFIDRLIADLAERLPPGRGEMGKEVERNLRVVLAEGIARLDLITREEFDIQQQVLARTRAKLEQLEQQVAALEKAR